MLFFGRVKAKVQVSLNYGLFLSRFIFTSNNLLQYVNLMVFCHFYEL